MTGLLHVVQVPLREPAATAGEPFEHLVFPIDCVFSIVALFESGNATEVGTVGREGFVPTEIMAGAHVAQRSTFCQVGGRAAIMHRDVFRRNVAPGSEFAALVQRNANARLFTAEQLTACNLTHNVLQRLGRWLLMTRDRVGRDRFQLTHEVLAMMLGVRRASVTQAAGALQRVGAISYHRGNITIIDNDTLTAAACECYLQSNAVFEAALQPNGRPHLG